MKSWIWVVLTAIITFAALELFHMSLWLVIALLLPLIAIGLAYASLRYNVRNSLKIEEVPKYGYAPRLKDLDEEAQEIERLSFERFDRFYLKTIPDSITDAYKHKKAPIILCVYHFGQKHSFDLTTRFQDDYYLTTANNIDAGVIPMPPGSLLQIYHNQHYDTLFKQHKEAIRTITKNGIEPFDLPKEEFRHHLMKTFRDQMKRAMKWFLWPVVLIVRTIRRPGKVYCKSIAEQYPGGIPRD